MRNQGKNKKKLSLSVAMCTYNGEEFLEEQLDSISGQTCLPDELVVCDDGSTDATLQILADFEKQVAFPVRIYSNEQRLGPTKNFGRAFSLCDCDVIAFSDQDDVWLPSKLETLIRILERHPSAGYVFSDAVVVDQMLRPLGYTLWERIPFTMNERKCYKQGRQLDVLLRHNVVNGSVMAFRSYLRDIALPIPEETGHDAWVALVSSAAGKNGILAEEPLIHYRQHQRQVVGGLKHGFFKHVKIALSRIGQTHREKDIVVFLELSSRLLATGVSDRKNLRMIQSQVGHVRVRQMMAESSLFERIEVMQGELVAGRYHKYSFGWKSLARDLFMSSLHSSDS